MPLISPFILFYWLKEHESANTCLGHHAMTFKAKQQNAGHQDLFFYDRDVDNSSTSSIICVCLSLGKIIQVFYNDYTKA